MVNFYSITYDANGSTAGITPVMQAAESNNDTYYFALSEGLDLKKSGYSFIGWAEDKDAIDPKYIAGSTISLSQEAPNKTLHAVWREDKVWADITKMQELTPNTCRGLALNTSKQLTDERDSKLYWVTRLADGNCWMTQNLDYDITTTDIANVIKFDNKTGLAEWPNENDGVARYYDPGNFYKTDTGNWSYTGCHDITDGFDNAGCTTTASWRTTVTSEEEKHFHVGNYYNWYAATNNSGTDNMPIGINATDSICPAGWRLPMGGIDKSGSYGGAALTIPDQETTDVRSLAGAYKLVRNGANTKSLRQDPMYFLPNGFVRGALYNAGSTVFYWSSTTANAYGAYDLYFTSLYLDPAHINNYHLGFPARCLILSL